MPVAGSQNPPFPTPPRVRAAVTPECPRCSLLTTGGACAQRVAPRARPALITRWTAGCLEILKQTWSRSRLGLLPCAAPRWLLPVALHSRSFMKAERQRTAINCRQPTTTVRQHDMVTQRAGEQLQPQQPANSAQRFQDTVALTHNLPHAAEEPHPQRKVNLAGALPNADPQLLVSRPM